mgnify:CR=1 FL=1|jgi:thymidine kinase|tara:strand:+ start:1010 stop:1552 length:543 start_codon:yes stop_codon:yes gene_type:complete
MAGYLELILGCMFSGKTTKLLEIYNMYSICDVSCCVINSSLDKRYSNTNLVTHDKKSIPCIFVEKLNSITTPDVLDKYNVFLINEGQFFTDLYDSVIELVCKHHKKVYICGLDGDFQREKYGQILDLIPKSDKFFKLYAICKICKDGTSACFSKRITNENTQTIIGSNNYIPVCRKCYEN